MMNFILFLFSTIGLVLILTKSVLFKSVREYFTSRNILMPINPNNPYILVPKNRFWWFLDSIMNCQLCAGIWFSTLTYWLIYGEMKLIVISFCFAGAFASHFTSELIDFIKRK